ncbi:MAG: DUF4931 domain-containing protein [Patescibacteria group bacterium]
MKNAEIRQDYVHNRTVIVAPSRAKRAHNFLPHLLPPAAPRSSCPFEPDKIDKIKALRTVGSGKKWQVKVIKNIFPIVRLDNPKAYGQQEVVIETPEHDVELAELTEDHIVALLKVYAQRTKELARNKKIQYVLIFKNNGGRAGATIDHAHSQIFATDFLPPHILLKLTRAQEFRIRYGQCYYCDLIKREAKGSRFIMQDDNFISLAPYASNYNYEAILMPKRHVDNITEFSNPEFISLAKQLKALLSKLNTIELPYNFYIHQVTNYAGEHFYLRLAPRRDIWAGIELGSRLIVNTVPPEDAAKFYQQKIKTKKKSRRSKKKK